MQQRQQRDVQQLQPIHPHLPSLPQHSRLYDMRGPTSSNTVRPNTRRATKPAHNPEAIGIYNGPNAQWGNAPAVPEPSTGDSVHSDRNLPTKLQESWTSTRSRMRPLATEPSKPRLTKHALRHNPLRSIHRLPRPTTIHPGGKSALGAQRPHLNHDRHRNTRVYKPNP